MPDGTVIKVKDQRFSVLEILFHPENYRKEAGGIAQKCYESINKSDILISVKTFTNALSFQE